MKKVLLCGLFLLLVNTCAHGQHRVSSTTGNTLLEACESKGEMEFKQAFCFGYITGMADYLGIDGAAFPERRAVCMEKEVTNGQVTDVVVKYLKDHPEERHLLAATLVVKALAKAFPCN